MNKTNSSSDSAVSPVVGVLLMLVVTIIIAAVVSSFAGGMASGQTKAPQLSMDGHIMNAGNSGGSGFRFEVTGVSEPISTKDLKIITSWTARDGTSGGAIVIPYDPSITPYTWTGHEPQSTNTNMGQTSGNLNYHTPKGWGPGVKSQSSSSGNPDQFFGNYTLKAGTQMYSGASGNYGKITLWEYDDPAASGLWVNTDVDPPRALLGFGWETLREGDTVNVQFLHLPSGKVIYNADIKVEGP